MKFADPSFQPARRALLAGISLIEVVLSLGILAFAIVPLIGLLAIGSTGYRDAMDQTVEAAIIQNVRTMAGQVTNITNLPVSYYKDDGTPTDSNSAMVLYKVVNTVTNGVFVGTNANGTNILNQTIADQYSIIHIPSGRTNAVGVIHVCPRPQ